MNGTNKRGAKLHLCDELNEWEDSIEMDYTMFYRVGWYMRINDRLKAKE